MEWSEAERTLLVVREVLVYKIPPRPGASGYRCQDWGKETFIFSGRLRVTAVGKKCTVLLEDANTGELFAQVPLNNEHPEVSVEPVTDSSRYFAIRVDDGQGRHAMLGLGFRERSEAFDFNVALQDHVKQARGEAQAEESMAAAVTPALDLSLKQGETLKINIGGLGGSGRKREPAEVGGGGLGALPPPLSAPPGAGTASRRRPTGLATPTQAGDGGTADLLGGESSNDGFGGGGFASGGGFGSADGKGGAGCGWTTFG